MGCHCYVSSGKKLKKDLSDFQEEHTDMEQRHENEYTELQNEVKEKTHELMNKQRNMTAQIKEMMREEDQFMEAKLTVGACLTDGVVLCFLLSQEVRNKIRASKPPEHAVSAPPTGVKDIAGENICSMELLGDSSYLRISRCCQ